MQFSFAANATIPNSYTRTDAGFGVYNDVHQLSYDAQNRITQDTSVSGSGFVAYFSYPPNQIAISVYFSPGAQNYIIDTMYLNSGDISSIPIYLPNSPGTADSLNAAPVYSYSAYANQHTTRM